MKKTIKLIFFLLILAAAVIFPSYEFNFDVSTVLTSISLLFTILIGFFMAAATSNYLGLQATISKEDSCLIYIYGLIKIIRPTSAEAAAQAVDGYMITALDYELLEYAAYTNKEFEALVKVIDDVCVSNAGHVLIQNLQSAKGELLTYRMESVLATQRIVSKKHWFILSILSVIISILLLSVRDGEVLSSLLIGMVIIAIYQTLALLYEIDSNIFLADKIGYGDEPQTVFRAIGKPEYYPEKALKFVDKKKLGDKYRVGVYLNYPASFEKTINLVEGSKK
ncbi:MAG: hypothetical protein V1867_02675 [Candidatus Falkowbacteria bacterium]